VEIMIMVKTEEYVTGPIVSEERPRGEVRIVESSLSRYVYADNRLLGELAGEVEGPHATSPRYVLYVKPKPGCVGRDPE
jgi:hypothetical protein